VSHQRAHSVAMETFYFWRHTSRVTGRRIRTRHRLTDADAAHQLLEPERIEYGALPVEPLTLTPGGH
jgi:hypothetical protein